MGKAFSELKEHPECRFVLLTQEEFKKKGHLLK